MAARQTETLLRAEAELPTVAEALHGVQTALQGKGVADARRWAEALVGFVRDVPHTDLFRRPGRFFPKRRPVG